MDLITKNLIFYQSGGIKENSLKEIDNLYKIIHRTSNFKIKIQTLLFIFQFLNVDKSLNDRYFRVLYELVNNFIISVKLQIYSFRSIQKKYGIVH